jgi:hypothetical protein
MSDRPTYSEPTELWRLRNAEGRIARAVLVPAVPKSTLVWFIGSELPADAEDFEEWAPALRRAEALKRALLGAGWNEASAE